MQTNDDNDGDDDDDGFWSIFCVPDTQHVLHTHHLIEYQ